MFRLYLEIPLTDNEEESKQRAESLVRAIVEKTTGFSGVEIGYRLGNDEDRNKKNYLVKTDSGHATTKKSTAVLT